MARLWIFSRLLRAKMLAFSLCFQPLENLNNAKFQKNTKKTKNTSKKKFDRVLFTFFSNNPAYWTFFSFLLRVKNIAFCLCFGLIHSLGICQNFVGLRVGAKNPAYWTFFSNNPAYWTFLLFLLRVKTLHFAYVLAWLTRWEFVEISSDWVFQSGGRGKEQKEKLDRVAFCPEAQNQPFWQRRSYI